MKIIKETNINFMGQRKLTTIFSAFVILVGVISLVVNGGPKLSIDFKGGTLVSVQYTEAMDVTNDISGSDATDEPTETAESPSEN